MLSGLPEEGEFEGLATSFGFGGPEAPEGFEYLRKRSSIFSNKSDSFIPTAENSMYVSRLSDCGDSSDQRDLEELRSSPSYKTELCKNFRYRGVCEWGQGCTFAHGPGELKPKITGLYFKNRDCRAFVEDGFCRFGEKCQFRHAPLSHRRELEMNVAKIERAVESNRVLCWVLSVIAGEQRRLRVFRRLSSKF